jgi:hypothetical protein
MTDQTTNDDNANKPPIERSQTNEQKGRKAPCPCPHQKLSTSHQTTYKYSYNLIQSMESKVNLRPGNHAHHQNMEHQKAKVDLIEAREEKGML